MPPQGRYIDRNPDQLTIDFAQVNGQNVSAAYEHCRMDLASFFLYAQGREVGNAMSVRAAVAQLGPEN